jgi:hypothetical protein
VPLRCWYRQSGRGFRATTIVGHRQNAELTAGLKSFRQKIQDQRGSAAVKPASACSCRMRVCGNTAQHRQTLSPANAARLLFIHHHAHTLQQDSYAPRGAAFRSGGRWRICILWWGRGQCRKPCGAPGWPSWQSKYVRVMPGGARGNPPCAMHCI